MTDSKRLHLPDLEIKGFRGIDELSIPQLGQVTLLAGKNSIGKTTVLDAVRVYAARGSYSVLSNLLWEREEVNVVVDEEGNVISEPDWLALFFDRDASDDFHIAIRPCEVEDPLTIELTIPNDEQLSLLNSSEHDSPVKVIKVVFRHRESLIPYGIPPTEPNTYRSHRRVSNRSVHRQWSWVTRSQDQLPEINCESLGPGLLENDDLSRYWDNVALTDDENAAVEALRLAFDRDIDGTAVIGDDQSVGRNVGRHAVVKLKDLGRRVPLRSLGDGAQRLFGVALALANSRDGFLLIDEAENGIHYSVQRAFWKMILRTANENNVQVLATTHSGDCIRGFVQAATELEDVDGALVRLDRQNGSLSAVTYSEESLRVAAEQGIEVR